MGIVIVSPILDIHVDSANRYIEVCFTNFLTAIPCRHLRYITLIILVLVCLRMYSNHVIYNCKLPRPSCVVQELPQVKPVVIR